MKFIKTIVQFNDVLSCFGQDLRDDFRNSIVHFEGLYRELEIPATPKLNMVFNHAIEFLEMN